MKIGLIGVYVLMALGVFMLVDNAEKFSPAKEDGWQCTEDNEVSWCFKEVPEAEPKPAPKPLTEEECRGVHPDKQVSDELRRWIREPSNVECES